MTSISVQVSISGGNDEQTDRLARSFRRELLEMDTDTVKFDQPDPAPHGAKGDLVTTGTLIATLANSAVLASICQLARSWVTLARGRRIIIKNGDWSLELDGGNSEQHQKLIDAFLSSLQEPD
jgi:hypothetical protein